MTNKKIALHFIIKPSPIGTYPNFWRSYSSESEAWLFYSFVAYLGWGHYGR